MLSGGVEAVAVTDDRATIAYASPTGSTGSTTEVRIRRPDGTEDSVDLGAAVNGQDGVFVDRLFFDGVQLVMGIAGDNDCVVAAVAFASDAPAVCAVSTSDLSGRDRTQAQLAGGCGGASIVGFPEDVVGRTGTRLLAYRVTGDTSARGTDLGLVVGRLGVVGCDGRAVTLDSSASAGYRVTPVKLG